MSVEYRNLLLPHDRAFVPTAGQIAEFVRRLRVERWVLTSDDDAWVRGKEPWDATGGRAETFVPKVARHNDRLKKALPIPIPVDAEWLEARRDRAGENPLADELSLVFPVVCDGESWAECGMPYPLAYGESERGCHTILIQASRDYVSRSIEDPPVHCACGESAYYEVPPQELAPIDFEGRFRSKCRACGQALAPAAGRPSDNSPSLFAVIVDCQESWPVERRVGEPMGVVRALEQAGYSVTNPAAERPRAAADLPGYLEFDAGVLRSPYGDPAPPVNGAFVALVERTFAARFDSVPEFY